MALGLCLGLAHLVTAQLSVPQPSGHVVDQTATLSAQQQATLEQSLSAYEARTGSQLAVLVVSSTRPEPVEQYALRVAEQWKLGRKKVDDGLLLLVAKDDHAVRIEVGYGLEGALPDVSSKRIINELILPHFRQDDLYGGISVGMDQIMHVLDGEALPAPVVHGAQTQAGWMTLLPFMLVLALALSSLLRSTLGPPMGSVLTAGIVGGVTWLLVGGLFITLLAAVAALFYTLVGGNMSYGPGRGAGRGWGGMGGGPRAGGGFSGGGGSFGGGGASGHW
jgi:uncharacterized protein